MKVLIAHNRVAELTAEQMFKILGDYFKAPEGIRSIRVTGRSENDIANIDLVSPYLTEVRWSEETEERDL